MRPEMSFGIRPNAKITVTTGERTGVCWNKKYVKKTPNNTQGTITYVARYYECSCESSTHSAWMTKGVSTG